MIAMIQIAFVPPLRSSRRKMSEKTDTKIQIAINQKKKYVMAIRKSPRLFTKFLRLRVQSPSAIDVTAPGPMGRSAPCEHLCLRRCELLVAEHPSIVELAELLQLLHVDAAAARRGRSHRLGGRGWGGSLGGRGTLLIGVVVRGLL